MNGANGAPEQSGLNEHAEAVCGMFARIAGVYDFLNHFLSLGIDRHWRRALAHEAQRGEPGRVLDLACGTLDVALAIAREEQQAKISAIDFCLPMLEQGRKKLAGKFAARIFPTAADARRLPLADACVDCVTMAFGIRNIQPRRAALCEMWRVLAPGGRACILEFASGREKILGGLYNFYLNRILPAVGNALAKDRGAYSYLAKTISAFPPAADFARELAAAGFCEVSFQRLTCGIAVLHTARKPHA